MTVMSCNGTLRVNQRSESGTTKLIGSHNSPYKEEQMYTYSPIQKLGSLAAVSLIVMVLVQFVENWKIVGPLVVGVGIFMVGTCMILPIVIFGIMFLELLFWKK